MSTTLIVIIIIAVLSLASGVIYGVIKRSVLKGIGEFFLVLAAACMTALTIWAIWHAVTPPRVIDEYTVQLAELDDGVYAYQSEVISRVPVENYSMLTVCSTSGNVISIKGTVKIVYQNTTSPYAEIIDKDVINSDIITAYVPNGSVLFNGSTSVH